MGAHNHEHHQENGHGNGHGDGHEHYLKMARREDGTPWWSDFPEPRSATTEIEPEHVLRLLQDQERLDGQKRRDFLLVDTRRTDCTGGTVRGSMNLPAHSFYPTRKTLHDLCTQAGINESHLLLWCVCPSGQYLVNSKSLA